MLDSAWLFSKYIKVYFKHFYFNKVSFDYSKKWTPKSYIRNYTYVGVFPWITNTIGKLSIQSKQCYRESFNTDSLHQGSVV